MKNKFSNFLVILVFFLLSSCALPDKHNLNKHEDNVEFDFMYANEQLTPKEKDSTLPQNKNGYSYLSTNNKCLDDYNFLREEHYSQYPQYAEDYKKISQGFSFLNANGNIMDKDAKKIYMMELKMKLTKLCSKIQYSSFILINEKKRKLSDI